MTKMYRMFEEKNDLPHTLFHGGVNGSRQLPLDTWIFSKTALVRDGNKGKLYKSGFHVLFHLKETINFLNRFRKLENRVICEIEVDKEIGIWPKEHSPTPVFLVKKIY